MVDDIDETAGFTKTTRTGWAAEVERLGGGNFYDSDGASNSPILKGRKVTTSAVRSDPDNPPVEQTGKLPSWTIYAIAGAAIILGVLTGRR